jgi:uncharacterized membrane protein
MLPWKYRLYFWGVHGVFVEVVFTAIWELVAVGNPRLMGQSSLWSFLIYGLGAFFGAELLREMMIARRVPLWARCLLYLPMTYCWEFLTGAVLRLFGACPWDYSQFDYDVMGLITMEYAPLWLMGGVYFEFLMSCMTEVDRKTWWNKTS